MPEKPARFVELLKVLDAHGVEYVLVGAVAANIHGAPVATYDVDIVHRREAANVARLVAALSSIGAYYWEHAPKRLLPEERILMLPGHHSLQTDLGRIDVLGTIGAGRSFEDLAAHTAVIHLDAGWSVRVLDLDAIIRSKREAGRPKDLAALPALEAALAESQRGGHGASE